MEHAGIRKALGGASARNSLDMPHSSSHFTTAWKHSRNLRAFLVIKAGDLQVWIPVSALGMMRFHSKSRRYSLKPRAIGTCLSAGRHLGRIEEG